MSEWWAALWFFLPAGAANLSPVIANRIPILKRWNTPMDFGRSWNGHRIFGDHKTWRGILFGAAVAVLVGWLQYRVITYSAESIWFIVWVSGLLGVGALFGDAVESMFKRRIGIKPGQSWFPFDQIDYIIGGLLFAAPFVDFSLGDVARIFVLYFGLHLVFSYIGFLVGLKDKPI